MPPFWLSIGLLSLLQGALVALAGDGALLELPWFARRRSRLWAAIPPLSVSLFVLVGQAAPGASATGLTYLALVAVPLLAAVGLGWLMRGARPVLALAVVPLFAVAWVDRAGLAGQGAAVVLSGLSCVALGVLIAAVTPARWLAVGIVLMACADAALVISELLQRPNEVLTAAHPAAGLPRLQAEVFGSAAMGYGDIFVAGTLGGLLARHAVRRGSSARVGQLRGALLVAFFAAVFDLLFFAVDELPATVPVAAALIALVLTRRRATGGARAARAFVPAPTPAGARVDRQRAGG